MNGPDAGYREHVWGSLEEIRNFDGTQRFVSEEIEQQLGAILREINEQVRADVQSSDILARGTESEEEARDVLSSVEAWASVASYAVSWIYAPQSPLSKRLAGWIKDVPDKLREIAAILKDALLIVANALRIASWSIGVVFPWGVSVSLGWNV